MSRVVVVGGGIAGLSVAYALQQRLADEGVADEGEAVEIVVLEKSDRPGGNIRTERIAGYVCEWGPNGFLDSAPETIALVHALGLQDLVQVSDDAARRRFIYRRGVLHQVPDGPLSFLRSGLLSWHGKLRILAEPLARGRRVADESVHDFAARRIGREAADLLIDPMVSGIFAGDARRLSLRACFPRMWTMETEHGSLFRALLALRRTKKRGEGLDSLPPVTPVRARPPATAASGSERAILEDARRRRPTHRGPPPDTAGPSSSPGGNPSHEISRTATGVASVPPKTGMAMPAGRLTSFRDGMEVLIAGLVRELGGVLRTGVRVKGLREASGPSGDRSTAESTASGPGVSPGHRPRREAEDERISAAAGSEDPREENARSRRKRPAGRFLLEIEGEGAMEADAVVLASPAAESARLVALLDPQMGRELDGIASAPVVVACLGFEASKLPRPLDGFGFLVPRGEGLRILGALWDSSVYPGRAPRGRALIRAMMGGARDPDAIALSDGAILEIVRRDLRAAMRLDLAPELVHVFRHPLGIPQYAVGHRDRLERIEARRRLHPGLFLAGNSYRGVSINSCVAEAGPLAGEVLSSLVLPPRSESG